MDVNAPHLRFKDQNRRERTWTIHLIALEKITKGTILIIVALRMLTLLGQDVHEWAVNFVSRHGIDVGNRETGAVQVQPGDAEPGRDGVHEHQL